LSTIWHITASVDGYIAPLDGALDWFMPYVGPNALASRVAGDIGAIVMGHRQYANAIRPEGRVYGGAYDGPLIVLTHAEESSAEPGFTFVHDLDAAIQRALAAAAGRRVVVMGADTARQCLRAGLLDEVLIHTVPVLLGAGLRMFEDAGGEVRLERIEADASPNAMNAWYRVKK
jgi:dihydrofolate reductase